MTCRWTEPSWLGRATRCRAPTSTASPCPPTPTFSPTCWGACRLQPCRDCLSVDTAPPHQPVSRVWATFQFSLRWFAFCMWKCLMLWLLCRFWVTGGMEIYFPLCVCPGFSALLWLTVSGTARLLCVFAYILVCWFKHFHLVLFRSFLFERCVCMCVCKCVLVNRHTHTHMPMSPLALSLIYKPTHTHCNVNIDHKEMRQDNQKGALFIWGTHIWQVFRK